MLARAELSRLRGELVKSDEHRLSGGPLRSELTNTQRTAARDQRLTLNAKMTDLISRQRHRVRESLFHRVATGIQRVHRASGFGWPRVSINILRRSKITFGSQVGRAPHVFGPLIGLFAKKQKP